MGGAAHREHTSALKAASALAAAEQKEVVSNSFRAKLLLKREAQEQLAEAGARS